MSKRPMQLLRLDPYFIACCTSFCDHIECLHLIYQKSPDSIMPMNVPWLPHRSIEIASDAVIHPEYQVEHVMVSCR